MDSRKSESRGAYLRETICPESVGPAVINVRTTKGGGPRGMGILSSIGFAMSGKLGELLVLIVTVCYWRQALLYDEPRFYKSLGAQFALGCRPANVTRITRFRVPIAIWHI